MQLADINDQLENGLRVFHFYLGSHVKVGRHYKSVFGHDGRPSFHLYVRESDGQVCFKDFAFDEMQGSCYDFVMKQQNVGFKQAVALIKRDVLGLSPRELEAGGLTSRAAAVPPYNKLRAPVAGPAETVTITGYPRAWTPQDLTFFAATGIGPDTLEKYHCYPLDSYLFSKGDKRFTISSTLADPIYGYYFPLSGHWKIYRPFAQDARYKWCSNVDARCDLFGWDTLPQRCKSVYLCAGQRDAMSLHALTGLPCLALNSETARLPAEIYQLLRCVADEVHCCLDNDKTGQAASLKLRYEWGIYDAGSEVLEAAGANDVSELLAELYDPQHEPAEIMARKADELRAHFCTFSGRVLSVS